jgi:hypothetical protein
VVLLQIQGAKGSVPLAIEEAHACAIEDVEHVCVVASPAGAGARRSRREEARLRHSRSAEELHLIWKWGLTCRSQGGRGLFGFARSELGARDCESREGREKTEEEIRFPVPLSL